MSQPLKACFQGGRTAPHLWHLPVTAPDGHGDTGANPHLRARRYSRLVPWWSDLS